MWSTMAEETPARRHRFGNVALLGLGLADLAWLLWPWAARAYAWSGIGPGGGSGSVSVGISDAMIVTSLMPVPLALHGLAQVVARRAGAHVRRLWRLHVYAFLYCVAVALLAAQVAYAAVWLLPALLVALVGVGIVLVGQHVVIAIVIWRGLRADWRRTREHEPSPS